MKHTPGPWRWIDRYDFREHLEHRKSGLSAKCENIEAGRIVLTDSGGVAVLDLWADYADDCGIQVNIGDAHLIAAAPDLLEAAKVLLKYAIEDCEPVGTPIYGDAIELAKKAIKKAEGK